MAIEIREVVIRASISKNTSGGRETYISKSEVAKMQEKLMAKINNVNMHGLSKGTYLIKVTDNSGYSKQQLVLVN